MIKERTVSRRTSAKDTGKRYEVRYRDPDGRERSRTFVRKGEAEVYERKMRSALDHGGWIDPRHATVTFKAYSDQYLSERTDLRPRTEELYRSLLRRHILPTFGTVPGEDHHEYRARLEWKGGRRSTRSPPQRLTGSAVRS